MYIYISKANDCNESKTETEIAHKCCFHYSHLLSLHQMNLLYETIQLKNNYIFVKIFLSCVFSSHPHSKCFIKCSNSEKSVISFKATVCLISACSCQRVREKVGKCDLMLCKENFNKLVHLKTYLPHSDQQIFIFNGGYLTIKEKNP